MDNEKATELLADVFSRAVVLGWENVRGRDGKEIPFSAENCMKLLLDLPALFKDIQEQAELLANYRAKKGISLPSLLRLIEISTTPCLWVSLTFCRMRPMSKH